MNFSRKEMTVIFLVFGLLPSILIALGIDVFVVQPVIEKEHFDEGIVESVFLRDNSFIMAKLNGKEYFVQNNSTSIITGVEYRLHNVYSKVFHIFRYVYFEKLA